jgi:hypothetical protein
MMTSVRFPTPAVFSSIAGSLKTLILATALLAPAGSCLAAGPNNASLDGTYVFHISTVHEGYWYKTKNCTYETSKGTSTFTYSGGGQRAFSEIINGQMTFNGKGGVSITYTNMNSFNQTASNNSVIIPACPAKEGASLNINNGSLVLETQGPGTIEATYAVESNGAGTITLPDGQGTLDLNLTAFTSTGLSTTVLILNPDNATDTGTGIAVHK